MYQTIISDLKRLQNPQKAQQLAHYFKTGKGGYGEGDVFWGIPMPLLRGVAKKFLEAQITDVEQLLHSPVHEQRMTALLILLYQFNKFKKDPARRLEIYNYYLSQTKYINNWDLVDVTCRDVVDQLFNDLH